jgi:hypothetical protein
MKQAARYSAFFASLFQHALETIKTDPRETWAPEALREWLSHDGNNRTDFYAKVVAECDTIRSATGQLRGSDEEVRSRFAGRGMR